MTSVDFQEIPLLGGGCTLVSVEDYYRTRGVWRRLDTRGRSYAYRGTSHGGMEYLHRAILGEAHHLDVDHINGDGLDNRRENLRLATRSQNLANSASRGGTSKFKGVCWDKRKQRWLAQVTVDGQHRFLGYYDEEVDAALAYDSVAFEAWGDRAHLNLPVLLGGVV